MGCSYSYDSWAEKAPVFPSSRPQAALRKMVRTLGSRAFPKAAGAVPTERRRRCRRPKGGAALAAGEECAEDSGENIELCLLDNARAHAEEPSRAAPAVCYRASPPAIAAAVLLLVSLDDEDDDACEHRRQCRRLESLERTISPFAGALTRFSYAEILMATRDFLQERELGSGGGTLSRVYKGRVGRLAGRKAVAIKRIVGRDNESIKAFCRELVIAGSLRRHKTVVLPIGFCVDVAGLFLVYEFVSGGSLDSHLHQQNNEQINIVGMKKKKKVMTLGRRYKVAVGLATALEHLHLSNTDRCVVHRDVKSSNILLSSNKTPKLCDFGLATLINGPPSLCKSVKGTFGYLAPEYFQHGKLSDKTDIYAFGVVLLELITGRTAIDHKRPRGEENLVLWAKPLLQAGHEEAIAKLADPKLKPGSCRRGEMSRLVSAAAACVIAEESRRPRIGKVLVMLRGEDAVIVGRPAFAADGFPQATYAPTRHARPAGNRNTRGRLKLAMLGVSDSEDDDLYGR